MGQGILAGEAPVQRGAPRSFVHTLKCAVRWMTSMPPAPGRRAGPSGVAGLTFQEAVSSGW